MEDHSTMMRAVELTDEDWGWFLEQIADRELDYYWFKVDWLCCRDRTRIWSVREGDRLIGAMLTFGDRICQLRGERGSAETLLDRVDAKVVELVVPLEWADLLDGRFVIKRKEEILTMSVRRGQERLVAVREPERLSSWDLDGIVSLLHESDRITWGDLTAAGLADSVATGAWYGIRQNGRIVAVAGSWMKGDPKHVNMVAVSRPFRGQGYARSVLSRLLEEMLLDSDMALINVRTDNVPALRAYRAVGFVPQLTYCRAVLAR